MGRPVDDLLRQLRDGIREERERAEDAINTLVRTQVAQGLAPLFIERSRPYDDDGPLASMMQGGWLDRAAFVQKPPELLRFYMRLLLALDRAPQTILEIGVKGGGSTALWKAVFPSADVIGLDIKLRRWLTSGQTDDGVIYLEGDQSDTVKLGDLARQHGPFDVVIDDGSHVSDHQAITLRSLFPHVRPSGVYVIEDVHAPTKAPTEQRKAEYGEDIWPDFVLAMFDGLRSAATRASGIGAQLAADVLPLSAELLTGARALAIRRADRD
jgi:cephalosporin hydroxylase